MRKKLNLVVVMCLLAPYITTGKLVHAETIEPEEKTEYVSSNSSVPVPSESTISEKVEQKHVDIVAPQAEEKVVVPTEPVVEEQSIPLKKETNNVQPVVPTRVDTPMSSFINPPIIIVPDTATNYVEKLLGNSSITVSNIKFTGSDLAASTFSNGTNILGIDTGVLFSTGRVQPGNSTLGTPGDADLEKLNAGTTYDAISLEFDFVPANSFLTFNYVFGSKEYPAYVNKGFNDSFAFFVNGENMALVPGSSDFVSIDNVNASKNASYFIDNTDNHLEYLPGTPFGGITTVLPIQASVKPNEVNHIKMVIADTQDTIYDSFVAIEGNSLKSTGKVNVAYQDEDGNSISDETVYDGDIGTKLDIQPKEIKGYEFSKWSATPPTTISDKIVNLTAIYKKKVEKKYEVVFDSNGGSLVGTQTVLENDLSVKPTDPTKAGFTFAGWFSDKKLSTSWDFATPITKDTTLYAKWDIEKVIPATEFLITFNSNGGSAVDSQTVLLNDLVKEPKNPTKKDFAFEGWFTDDKLTTPWDFTTPVTKNITLYAKWGSGKVDEKFVVTFNSNGGSAVDSQTVGLNKLVKKPKNPTKEGYTFGGWFADPKLDKAWDFKTPITADTTLYAKWTKKAVPTTSNKTTPTGKTTSTAPAASSSDQKNLPKTGDTQPSLLPSLLGVMLVLYVYGKNSGFSFKKNKYEL